MTEPKPGSVSAYARCLKCFDAIMPTPANCHCGGEINRPGVPWPSLCPVCGFDMQEEIRDYDICPCCGTEFGYDDAGRAHEELRRIWVEGGMKFWHTPEQPEGWDAAAQLRKVAG